MNVKMLNYLLLNHILYQLLMLVRLNLFQDQMGVSAKDQNMDLNLRIKKINKQQINKKFANNYYNIDKKNKMKKRQKRESEWSGSCHT